MMGFEFGNIDKFVEILTYESNGQIQLTYDRKKYYLLLIQNYLNQLIEDFEFQNKFLKMEREDDLKARQLIRDIEPSYKFYLVNNIKDFKSCISKLSNLCEDIYEFGYEEYVPKSKDEFKSTIETIFQQLQKF